MLIYRRSPRIRRCFRPRTRSVNELVRRRRICFIRRIRIWINYYYTSPTLWFLAVLFRGAFQV